MGIKPQHIEGWRQMRYKEGSGWCTSRAEEDWVSDKRNEYVV